MTDSSSSGNTLRSLRISDSLWAAFNRRAEETKRSVEELVFEAMKQYAIHNEFVNLGASKSKTPPGGGRSSRPLVPTNRDKPSSKLPRPGTARPTSPVSNPPSGLEGIRPSAPPVPRRSVPPAPQRPSTPPPRPTLSIVFQGQKMPVTQDQFIIGRGSKTSDLAIKDANVSRKHAAIIFHNGAFYMKDLGSTNGVEFQGKPIDSKRIDEGDAFTICGYELKFTYSP